MKTTLRNLGGIALLGMTVLTAPVALAQDAVQSTTTTTTSRGTISEFSPDTIQVKTQTSSGPTSYSYTKTTTYVDENGNPVARETIKTGSPVTVYYDQAGNKMVATKVVVRRTDSASPVSPVQTTTSTTNSMGTINTFSQDAMTVQSDSGPVTYSSTKTTTYVDENGNPVSVETVKSGLPVTVYYTQDGDRMVANKVVVRRTVTTDPAPPVTIEKKTTTTTTTPAP